MNLNDPASIVRWHAIHPQRPCPKRAALMAQIEACRRAVASWPEWMRQERTAPAWMEGWDD